MEFQPRFHIFGGDGLKFPVGVRRLKAVAEVPLAVQLFAGVGHQLIGLVDIFGVITAGGVGKFAGVVRLQPRLFGGQQSKEPQLLAVLLGVLPQQGDALLQVAIPVGEAIAVLPAAFGKQPLAGQAVAGLVDAAPQVHGGKALVTGAMVLLAQKGQQVPPGFQCDRFEIQHKTPWIL